MFLNGWNTLKQNRVCKNAYKPVYDDTAKYLSKYITNITTTIKKTMPAYHAAHRCIYVLLNIRHKKIGLLCLPACQPGM